MKARPVRGGNAGLRQREEGRAAQTCLVGLRWPAGGHSRYHSPFRGPRAEAALLLPLPQR